MGGCGDGGSNGGGEEELINAVLTCKGNITDPDLPLKLSRLTHHLQEITYSGSKWLVEKVEPWNSVRVTFSIPKEAAIRLHQLAQAGDTALRQLGILSVQVDGDQIISLKVAGPNNEPTEIILRQEGVAGPSGENNSNSGHSSVGRSVTHGVGSTGMLPGFSQQHHHQPHPAPQFRSPSLESMPVVVGRTTVVRPPNQPYAYSGLNSVIQSRHSSGTAPGTSVAVNRPVYPNNPPPPYPSQEATRQTKNQPPPNPPVNGQAFQTNSVVNVSPQINSSVQQSVTSNYRPVGSHASTASSVSTRPSVRTPVNMVKNSPLLVGLLQQPEQSSSSIVGTRKPLPSQPLENGPLSTNIASGGAFGSSNPSSSSGNTYVGRSRDGLTTHQQMFSGGSVITNSLPQLPQRHLTPSGFHQGSPKITEESRKNTSLVSSSKSQESVSSCSSSLDSSSPLLNKLADSVDPLPTSGSPAVTASSIKKENQYLINPNTGLLEPRPTTDSSDSEAEGRTASPPHDDRLSNLVASDDESNLSTTSRKETDLSDSDVSRVSSTASSGSGESRRTQSVTNACSVLGKSRDINKDSSPASSWENNVVSSSSPGEKIKLRLKLGKEQVTQATIVGNTKQKSDRRETPTSENNSPTEPRVPKLHIKLHSSQPVIVKPADETTEVSSRNIKLKDTEKSKRKSNRKLKNDSISLLEPFKSKNAKLKAAKEKQLGEDIVGAKRTHKMDSDGTNSVMMKLKDESRLKMPRLSDKQKIDSKLRTRLKKPPIHKVGDLNSAGELASYKILETLPPSITKVAAMHTQQPHRNPSSSPPIPLSSLTPSLFGASGGASTSSSSDQLKAQLEKRGSEIIPKSEVGSKPDDTSDILMTKLTSQPIKSLRVNSQPMKGLMNGDVSHSEKLRFKATSTPDFPQSGSKLTIKRKGSDEMHTLEALKKEGLGNVPKFLNSSVLINKVSSEKSVLSNLVGSHRHGEDFCDKFLNKVEGLKSPLRSSEIAGLKSNSDITIHSVSKSDILGLDRRPDLTIKPKSEMTTKVGRVTCVDVMDRKALEEALKSSRISSKKNDVSLSKSTSSMVDRLRRWNSIDSSNRNPLDNSSSRNSLDSSNSVPFSSHSQPPTEESTNLYSMGTKAESEELALGLSSKKTNTVNNVNKSPCDSSNKDFGIKKDMKDESSSKDVDNTKDECSKNSVSKLNEVGDSEQSLTKKTEGCKIADLVNPASITKVDVDSPEGTPKGEHGNGQGGEDSGIESMDALSEKSPNHSDQSPHRRDEKDCEMFPDKCNNKVLSAESKDKSEEPSSQSFVGETSSTNSDAKEVLRDGDSTNTMLHDSSLLVKEEKSNSKDSVGSCKDTDQKVTTESVSQENSILGRLMINKNASPDVISAESDETSLQEREKRFRDKVSDEVIVNTDNSWKCSQEEAVSNSTGVSMSITTTSISVSSPKSTLVSSPSTASAIPELDLALPSSISSSFPPNLRTTSPKPSVLAITLSQPNATPSLIDTPTTSTVTSSAASSVSTVDDQSSNGNVVFCPNLTSSCNNNSIAYSNSYSSSATNATMIILSSSSSTTTPPNNTKVVTLKPSLPQATTIGKTFRLVALPSLSNSAMNQSANPVKGQLVTLKPVTTKTPPASLLQTCMKQEEPSKTTTLLSPVDRPVLTCEKTDDLDFVGFSKEEKNSTEEEPTPLRVHPPLYTYGNRERKKESELDSKEGDSDVKGTESDVKELESDTEESEKKMDALTIEIPPDTDEKRLTRSTRHSARLASPKVNAELSPKRQPGPTPTMGKPSPILRSSTSPALRVTKRRRHESESSNASSLSEDLQEPPAKVSRRKPNQDSVKDESKKVKTKDNEIDKDGETSDDESLAEEDETKKRNPSSSTNDEEDDASRPSKAVTRSKDRIRDTTPTRRAQRQTTRSAAAGTSLTNEVTKPPMLLQVPQQHPQTPPPGTNSEEIPRDKKFVATCGPKEVVIKTLVKGKRELESENARRKTRSAAANNAIAPEDANKRRRMSKEMPK